MWPSVRPQASAVETGRVLERDAGHATGTYIWARASSLNRVAHSLEVSEVRRLTSRRYDGLRVSITGEGITARGLVTATSATSLLLASCDSPVIPGIWLAPIGQACI